MSRYVELGSRNNISLIKHRLPRSTIIGSVMLCFYFCEIPFDRNLLHVEVEQVVVPLDSNRDTACAAVMAFLLRGVRNRAQSEVSSSSWLPLTKPMLTIVVLVQHPTVVGIPISAAFHQGQGTIPWQTALPGAATIGAQAQSMYNQCIGTPVASSNAANNTLPYATLRRDSQLEGTSSNQFLRAMPNVPEGGTFSSQGGVGAAIGEGDGDLGREMSVARDTSGSCRTPCRDTTPDEGRAPAKSLGRPASHRTCSACTTTAAGTLRELSNSATPQTPMNHASDTTVLCSPNSSKSSPPYTSSQRKQLRVEEKSYLQEVKKSIAEGRVPQVRLQQHHNGDIVQYKAQFLNALKLAALAIVPNAFIDIKNPSTMQEIMNEVRRQFIIEKPLPEGMVAGFLQRLYKRNRAVYHAHWTLHGDQSKPDDCATAAWLELVDYWKSMEGSNECERNKANASARKKTTVRPTELK